jgi:hypothetical protein
MSRNKEVVVLSVFIIGYNLDWKWDWEGGVDSIYKILTVMRNAAFEFHAAVSLKITVFGDTTPCSLVLCVDVSEEPITFTSGYKKAILYHRTWHHI